MMLGIGKWGKLNRAILAFRPPHDWDPRDGAGRVDCDARSLGDVWAADAGEGERRPLQGLLAREDERHLPRESALASPEKMWGPLPRRTTWRGPPAVEQVVSSGGPRQEVPQEGGSASCMSSSPLTSSSCTAIQSTLAGSDPPPSTMSCRSPRRGRWTTTHLESRQPPCGRSAGRNPGSSPLGGGSCLFFFFSPPASPR